MHERLLDKETTPSEEFIKEYLGKEGYSNLQDFESFLKENYDLKKELKFPFGNKYGWGYKYSHKTIHLCHAFIESGAFTITLQLGDSCVSEVEKRLPKLSRKASELWANRYPCGAEGGWIHYRVLSNSELKDLFELIMIKRKP